MTSFLEEFQSNLEREVRRNFFTVFKKKLNGKINIMESKHPYVVFHI